MMVGSGVVVELGKPVPVGKAVGEAVVVNGSVVLVRPVQKGVVVVGAGVE